MRGFPSGARELLGELSARVAALTTPSVRRPRARVQHWARADTTLQVAQDDVPESSQYFGLWGMLTCLTVIMLVIPDIPVAIYAPRLSVAVGSIAGVVALALLQLGLLRFNVLHRPIDLHAGLAFGVLAISNIYTVWVGLPQDAASLTFEHAAYFLLLLRATAVALFLTGLATAQRHQAGSPWRWSGWLGLMCATLLACLSVLALFYGGDTLPALVDHSTRELLATGIAIGDALPGQQPFLVLANIALAAAVLVSAIGYRREAQRLRDPHIAALAAGLIFIFFAQVVTVFFPSLPTDYVSAADGFRLVAYVLLLSNVMRHTGHDFAATATQNERLRLSRELHDGLAQQLAILRLRLDRVAELTPKSDERARDLEVARLVLESASNEARRAIAALRLEGIPWLEFEQALEASAAEFSLTHEIDARVWTETSAVRLDSQLQADVLRILQETFSNAARHGHATRVDAVFTVEGEVLDLIVRDDGRGFEPTHARKGVGLRSIAERVERYGGSLSVDSTPGQGTRIQALLPLKGLRGTQP